MEPKTVKSEADVESVCKQVARKLWRSIRKGKLLPCLDYEDVLQDARLVALQVDSDGIPPTLLFSKIYFRLIDSYRRQTSFRWFKTNGIDPPLFVSCEVISQDSENLSLVDVESYRRWQEEIRTDGLFTYWIKDSDGQYQRRIVSDETLDAVMNDAKRREKKEFELFARRLQGETFRSLGMEIGICESATLGRVKRYASKLARRVAKVSIP